MGLFDSLRNVIEGAAGDQLGGLADTAQGVLGGDLAGAAEQLTGHDVTGLVEQGQSLQEDPLGTAADLIGGSAP